MGLIGTKDSLEAYSLPDRTMVRLHDTQGRYPDVVMRIAQAEKFGWVFVWPDETDADPDPARIALGVVAPPKPWAEMTDDECDAFADELFDRMHAEVGRVTGDQTPPTVEP